MKKPRAKKPLAAPVLPGPSPPDSAPREDHDPIGPGDIVMLPDGVLVAVEKIVGADAYVIEWNKQIARGPWIFPISELVPVS